MNNEQAIVVKAENAGDYTTIDDLKGKKIAVESGSAGASAAEDAVGEDNTSTIIEAAAQVDALVEVLAGASDCAVIDVLLAESLVGTGNYSDLVIVKGIKMESEIYAVGFKKGDKFRDRVNKAIKELYEEGKLEELAKKYGLENYLNVDLNYKG